MTLENSEPKYRQLAALLRTEIKNGKFPLGSDLPSEIELAEQHDTTRATVNRALTILRSEGLVRSGQGRPTTVTELPVIGRSRTERQKRSVRESGDSRGAFEAELRSLGLTSRSDVSVGTVAAPAEIAALLGVEDGTPVLTRSRVMFANDIPVMLATSYFPTDITAGTQIEQVDSGVGGVYSRLAELGHVPAEFTEEITVRPPTPQETRPLRMDPDQRVLEVVRTAVTAEGRTVEVNRMVKPAHQWKLSYTWPAE